METTMRPLFPREGRLRLETFRTRARLRCGCDRVFLADVCVSIDIERDPGALEELTDEGLQRFPCPRCEQEHLLAEPILILDRERERMGLFIPGALGHRAAAFWAELATEIAATDPAALPPGAARPELLVGVQSLREWLFGPRGRSQAPGQPRGKPTEQAERKPKKEPAIHEAFADLAARDSQLPSAAPPAPEIEDVDEDEPMFGEDWLPRDTVPPVPTAAETPPPAEPPRAAVPPPPVDARPDAAIDFAGLLDEDEDDIDEDAAGGPVAGDDDREPAFDAESLVLDEDDDEFLEEEEEEDDEIVEDIDEDIEDEIAAEFDADDGVPGGSAAPTPVPRDFPLPLLEGAERCVETGEDGVCLSARLPADRAALFDPSTADLWFQLLDVGGLPLVALTLVSDPTMDRPHWVAWPVDPRRGADREILHALRRSYRAEIRLFDGDDREVARFPLSADRELNVSVVLDRASRVLGKTPPEEAEVSAALERLSGAEQPFGDPLPPLFTSYGLPPMETFEQTASALAELARWLEPERYDHLVLVRSLPLDYLEEIIVEVLDRAVRRGVRLPERLKDRAISLGHAPDRAALCRVLAENFDRVTSAGEGPPDEVAARNWRDLMTDGADEDAIFDPRIRDRAEELLEAHGLVDEETLREARAALAEPDGLETDQLRRMLQHRRLRPGAIAALCRRAEPGAWKDAVRALERLDPESLLGVVGAVAGLREAVSGEITSLLGAEPPHVRQAAAALLGGLALRRTLMPVLKALGAEPTPIWTEFARAAAATGSAAVRSIERQLTDEGFPLERLALAVHLLERDAPRVCARFEAMAGSGDARAARMMELARGGDIEPSRVAPAERYGELLRRAVAQEAISEREVAAAIEGYRALLER